MEIINIRIDHQSTSNDEQFAGEYDRDSERDRPASTVWPDMIFAPWQTSPIIFITALKLSARGPVCAVSKFVGVGSLPSFHCNACNDHNATKNR